jgi:hypothetical protein
MSYDVTLTKAEKWSLRQITRGVLHVMIDNKKKMFYRRRTLLQHEYLMTVLPIIAGHSTQPFVQ